MLVSLKLVISPVRFFFLKKRLTPSYSASFCIKIVYRIFLKLRLICNLFEVLRHSLIYYYNLYRNHVFPCDKR